MQKTFKPGNNFNFNIDKTEAGCHICNVKLTNHGGKTSMENNQILHMMCRMFIKKHSGKQVRNVKETYGQKSGKNFKQGISGQRNQNNVKSQIRKDNKRLGKIRL